MIFARHSVLKRGCSIWDKSQMPEEEFQSRMEKVRQAMGERRLDVLLIYGDTWSYANLCYLTHYFPKVRGALALIPRQGPASILLNVGSRDIPFAKSLTWVEEVRPSAQVGSDGAKVLKELGLGQAKIGLVDTEEGLPFPQAEELKKSLPEAQWEDVSPMLHRMRLKKSEREITVIQEAGRILKELFDSSKEIIQPGKREYEVAAELDRLARLKGVEDLRILIGDDSLRPPGDKKVGERGSLALYLAIQHRRYWVETGRTYTLGDDSIAKDLYLKVNNTLDKMVRALSPGKFTNEISQVARQELGEFYPQAVVYGLGNGIGLSQWEPPFLSEEPEAYRKPLVGLSNRLEKDMVLALRVVLQTQGKLILVGNSYQVTSEGVEALTV